MSILTRFISYTLLTLFTLLTLQAFLVNFTEPWWVLIADVFPWLNVLLKPHLSRNLGQGSISSLFPWLAIVIVISVIYIAAIFSSRSERSTHWIAVCFIFFILICRLFWISCFDSQLAGDFRTYWDTGQAVASGNIKELTISAIYIRRSLFYTAPIHYLFGNSQTALELVNIFLVTLSMIIFYEFGRKTFTPKIAAGSLLFFSLNPDIWYGVTLADPDIAFLPYLAGLCLVVYWLDKKISEKTAISLPLIFLSITAGILIFLIDVLRDFGSPAWVGLAILFFYNLYSHYQSNIVVQKGRGNQQYRFTKKPIKNGAVFFFFLLVLPMVAYRICELNLNREIGISIKSNYLSYLTATDVFGGGGSTDLGPWAGLYSVQLPEKLKAEFSVKRLLHELLSDPDQTLIYMAVKNLGLARPTTTLSFATWPATDPGIGRVNTTDIPMQRSLQHIISGTVYFLLLIRLLLHPLFSFRKGSLFLICYTAFFYIFILLFTESQGRYDVFTVFLTSLLVSELIFCSKQWFEAEKSQGITEKGQILLLGTKRVFVVHFFGMTGIALLISLLFIASNTTYGLKLTLLDMRGFKIIQGVLNFSGKDDGDVNTAGNMKDKSYMLNDKPSDGEIQIESIKNNFRELSFKMTSERCREQPGYVGFIKHLDKAIKKDGKYLRFFISGIDGDLSTGSLHRYKAIVILDEEVVWSQFIKVSKKPLFVEQSLDSLHNESFSKISVYVGMDSIANCDSLIGADRSINVSFNYFDIN